jgi:hypothetical protein
MKRGKPLRILLTALLLTALTSFSSCKTSPAPGAEAQSALAVLIPPMPVQPEMEPVHFEDHGDGGLWLSYNDYRSLERNVIAMREYAERLEITIKFYRGEQ